MVAVSRISVLLALVLLAGCGAAATPKPTPAPTPCIAGSIVAHRGAFASNAQQAALSLQADDVDAVLRSFRLMASEARSAADALRAARPELAGHLDRAADAIDHAATSVSAGNFGDANSWLSQGLLEEQQGLDFSPGSLCL